MGILGILRFSIYSILFRILSITNHSIELSHLAAAYIGKTRCRLAVDRQVKSWAHVRCVTILLSQIRKNARQSLVISDSYRRPSRFMGFVNRALELKQHVREVLLPQWPRSCCASVNLFRCTTQSIIAGPMRTQIAGLAVKTTWRKYNDDVNSCQSCSTQ